MINHTYQKKFPSKSGFAGFKVWRMLQILVKSCYKSVKREFPDYKNLTVLTAQTIQQYVTIPEEILYKWNKGIINNANFSDVLRVEILSKYGGIWLDATVYCTGSTIKELIEKNPFFYV